jgi:hypothetical protein
MKEIGGYFELEFNKGNSYHSNTINLNTARNCFEYVLRAKKIRKVLIPHYTCEVMLEPINKLGVAFEYYHIDQNLEPIFPNTDLRNYFILYTNYFGIKQSFIKNLSKRFENLIIDNSHAFFHYPAGKADTFYSARKFFGVPDGAFLYTDNYITETDIEQDISYNRIIHMIKRIEMGANEAYPEFLKNDKTLYDQPIRRMSKFSQTVLASIDYNKAKTIRERNFLYVHKEMAELNELNIELSDFCGPMFYPFLIKSEKIRKSLIENKIFVPTLWENVINTTKRDDFERYLTKFLFPLPIDQRYDINDMEYIISVIKSVLNHHFNKN